MFLWVRTDGAAIRYLTLIGCFLAVMPIVRFVLLPPLLRALIGVKPGAGNALDWRDRVELRYQNMDLFVWLFAWCKLRLDPMFRELPEFLRAIPEIRTALDLGCGYGFLGSSLLEWNPALRIYGVDPNPKRVEAASIAFGERGEVGCAGAPDFEMPEFPGRFDAVLCLDVIHFLSDEALALTLRRIRARLDEGGCLILRAPMLARGGGSISWKIDRLRRALMGGYACYRTVEQISEAVVNAGFKILQSPISGTNPELRWFVAVAASAKIFNTKGRRNEGHEEEVEYAPGDS
jgi:SAM-dependent methyltransferase